MKDEWINNLPAKFYFLRVNSTESLQLEHQHQKSIVIAVDGFSLAILKISQAYMN